MTVAEWCIFGTLMLTLLTIAPIKWIGFRDFDNAKPRDPAFYADPLRARALGAHQNGIEAFPFFAIAVLLAEFQLEGQDFMALNGGPMYKFTPAISLYVNCETQAEIDALWEKLSAGGEKPVIPVQWSWSGNICSKCGAWNAGWSVRIRSRSGSMRMPSS